MKKKRIAILITLLLAVLAGLWIWMIYTPPRYAPLGASQLYGDSMEPTLDNHSITIYTDATTIEEGDIIIYWSGEKSNFITHRVIDIENGHYITKGDNNPVADPVFGWKRPTDRATAGEILVEISAREIQFFAEARAITNIRKIRYATLL